MRSTLDGKLLVITGKGGVGKTTVAAAAGMLAAQSGRRTVVVEVGQESRIAELFGAAPRRGGAETRLAENLFSLSIDQDEALLEWLQALGGRVSGRVLASSGTFQYFAAAAPGAKELVTMVKIWRLTQRSRGRGYDLVVLDAPATGHALGMLGSPQTFGAIARVGPIARQTGQLRELLTSTDSSYVAVSLASETAVTEVLELRDGLRGRLGRDLDRVIVNALVPDRFNARELAQIAALRSRACDDDDGPSASATAAAVAAAEAVAHRARFQRNQLARLRRRQLPTLSVPLQWDAQLGLDAVSRIAGRLRRGL
jgi:anion-transporting  ArsA/GET3 family ATPase